VYAGDSCCHLDDKRHCTCLVNMNVGWDLTCKLINQMFSIGSGGTCCNKQRPFSCFWFAGLSVRLEIRNSLPCQLIDIQKLNAYFLQIKTRFSGDRCILVHFSFLSYFSIIRSGVLESFCHFQSSVAQWIRRTGIS